LTLSAAAMCAALASLAHTSILPDGLFETTAIFHRWPRLNPFGLSAVFVDQSGRLSEFVARSQLAAFCHKQPLRALPGAFRNFGDVRPISSNQRHFLKLVLPGRDHPRDPRPIAGPNPQDLLLQVEVAAASNRQRRTRREARAQSYGSPRGDRQATELMPIGSTSTRFNEGREPRLQ
jgi:hypothetical protein